MVTVEQIQRGVRNYIDTEIGSKAIGFRKFGVYFMLPSIDKYIVQYLNKMKEFMPEMFDENGMVDIDKIYNNAKSAIKKSGQFEFMGIIFNETDIDKLYSNINIKESIL